MSNKSSSKQHGLHMANEQRPKSKLRVRKNKLKASIRKAERRSCLHGAVKPLSGYVKADKK